MAECPGGRTNRGIRSQFRLALPGLGPSKGIYPIHLAEIMDPGQSTQRNIPSSKNLVSPNKLTLTVREYEQSIEKLTKENFDLKLKLYLYEENEKKFQEDRDSISPNHIQVIVQLKSETESLHNELHSKEELLKEALERADRFESEFKEIEKKYADLQSELSSLSELPSKEQFVSLLDEKENLVKYSETLEQELTKKDEEIHDANQKIEFLDNRIRTLEEKIKKRSIAIQGFVYKNYKEKEILPDELRAIVISANQAAKNKNKDNLAVAVKNITSYLYQCLKAETLEKSCSSHRSHSEPTTELSNIESLKEVLPKRNTPEMNLDAVIHDSFAKGKSFGESGVSVSKRDVIDFIDFSTMSPSTEENLIAFSNSLSNQACSDVDHSPIDIKTVSSDCTNKEKSYSDDELMKVLEENKQLKNYLEEKRAIIENLNESLLELQLKVADLQKTESGVSDENKKLKTNLKEQLALIADLRDTCKEFELKISHLQKTESYVSNENEKLKKNLEEKVALIDNLRDNCKDLQLKVSHLQEAENDGSDKNEKLKRDLQTAYKELELKRDNLQEIENNAFTENEKLKHNLNKQQALIEDLRATYKRSDMKRVHLQETGCDAFRAPTCSVYTQTDIARYNVLNEYELTKLQKDSEISNNVEELREDILLLLLAVEDKDKELSAVKQSLSDVQEDLKRALNTSAVIDKDFYENERNELHERLALSCSVNEDLVKQLKNLKKFMEDLLQNKFDSSVESIDEISISKCLDKTLQLSNALSDHLSFCEGSKLFEECESFIHNQENYFDEERNFQKTLSRRSLPERDSSYNPGAHILEECISYAQIERMKESNINQLYLQCWQQMYNTSQIQSQTARLAQNNIISRHVGYVSSDSDIWSEPDRNVSLQRIGISLQNSPVSSKSPRKLRQKEKRLSSRLSSEQDTSSSELRCTSKKRHASASRRLSFKENVKNQDFTSEKFYFLLAEKSNKFKGLLDELKSIENGKISEAVWIRLKTVAASVDKARQKLHIAGESTKDVPSAVCGRCVMLELFTDIKASHREADFFIDDSSSELAILKQFSREIQLLKDTCKEVFPLFFESTSRRSQSAQCDTFEHEQIKIDELENAIVDLNDTNSELSQKLENIRMLHSKEKEIFESVKTENSNLSVEINNLKQELSKLKQIESDLSLKNENLLEELSHANENNCELNKLLSDLEQKSKESGFVLDNLNAELQKNKIELVSMNEKCLEYEKQLNEQIQMKNECQYKLKTLETSSFSEKNNYLSKIDHLNAEKKSSCSRTSKCTGKENSFREGKYSYK